MMPEQEESIRFIKPVGLPPLMVVSFFLDPSVEVVFNDFYHNQFLPELFALTPQLRSIKRFEQYEIENATSTVGKEFFTFYELDREETLDKTDAIFGHSQFAKTLALFRQYKETACTDFKRVNYLPIYSSERVPTGAGLGTEAALYRFLAFFQLSQGKEDEFLDWYHQQILSLAPDLDFCHSYKVYDPGPIRLMTVYSAADEESMKKSLEQLGQDHFGSQNATWQSYCRDCTVLNPTKIGVRSIFSLP